MKTLFIFISDGVNTLLASATALKSPALNTDARRATPCQKYNNLKLQNPIGPT
jgi:hypothetical protein